LTKVLHRCFPRGRTGFYRNEFDNAEVTTSMAATVWKGFLTFGLISIPVRLFTAARPERISFNQLHKKTHARLKQQLIDPTTGEVVDRSDIVKGYAVGKDQYILVEDEEIKKVQPASSDTMEILEFVKLKDVDPIFYDASYFIVPEDAGRKPYYLLVDTMAESGFVAVAKISMHQREYTVLVRPRANGLTLHTMHYANELREVPEYGRRGDFEVKPQEIKLAQQLVESLAADFDPKKYADSYQARLLELIEAKQQGKEAQPTEAKRLAPVIDLMEALQQSLKDLPRKAPASAQAIEDEEDARRPGRKRASRKAAR
jgi:DNA end-binding protein Ku